MKYMEKIAYWKRVGQQIHPQKAILWFFAIHIPVVVVIIILFDLLGRHVVDPKPMHRLIRACIALSCFAIGIRIFWLKVYKPAIQAEAENRR